MIDDLHSDIIEEIEESDRNAYYLDNGLILDKYYKGDTQIKQQDDQGILSYFKKEDEPTTLDKEDQEEFNLMNQYLCNIDDTVQNTKYIDYQLDKCRQCNGVMYFKNNDGEIMCKECGYTEYIMIVTEKSSFNDPPREVSYFAYKRINHFNEWLAQFQAKETTELPDTIYRDVYDELSKNIDFDIKSINYKSIREILKKLKYNKYYEHIPHLINVLSGEKAPKLSRRSEEMLRSLFKEIQIPFMDNCPQNRKNFLSYSYVLHKFCELLELDHLLPFFPLLKSREKLQQQDQIWEKMCKDLKWQYIPSV
tara:strand:+ start:1000 stop:1923 length:924 start_codon:yes stop_codon:yes gene_type:complete